MDMKYDKSAKQCVNCPGATDHDTAHCPVMKYGALDPQQRLDVARGVKPQPIAAQSAPDEREAQRAALDKEFAPLSYSADQRDIDLRNRVERPCFARGFTAGAAWQRAQSAPAGAGNGAVWRSMDSDPPKKTGRYCVGHRGNIFGHAYYTARVGDTHYPVGWAQVPKWRPSHWLDVANIGDAAAPQPACTTCNDSGTVHTGVGHLRENCPACGGADAQPAARQEQGDEAYRIPPGTVLVSKSVLAMVRNSLKLDAEERGLPVRGEILAELDASIQHYDAAMAASAEGKA